MGKLSENPQGEPIFASDDKDARQLARDHGLDVIGPVGVLARGVERNEITLETADDWFHTWVNEGDYYPPPGIESIADVLPNNE